MPTMHSNDPLMAMLGLDNDPIGRRTSRRIQDVAKEARVEKTISPSSDTTDKIKAREVDAKDSAKRHMFQDVHAPPPTFEATGKVSLACSRCVAMPSCH